MKSIVVTRFSLRVPEYEERISLSESERADWFAYRAKIFNEATLRCLQRQTSPVTVQFLVMDHADQGLYERYICTSSFIEPVFSSVGEYPKFIRRRIAEISQGPILVARLDSDDLVSDTYIEELKKSTETPAIRERANSEGRILIKATHGYISDLEYIQAFVDPAPSFLAVYYPEFKGRLDLGGDHSKVSSRNPVECASAKWIRLIHGSNVQNEFYRRQVFKVDGESWPADTYRPREDIIDRSLFGPDASSLSMRSKRLRLWLLARRGGPQFVRIASRLAAGARRITHVS